VGHAGTLDPFASGLLLLLLGPATRLSEYFLGLDKEYLATARLGIETSTHDPEGEVIREEPTGVELSREAVESALLGFRGPQLQTPPRYSSKKVAGEPAHRRVRRGETVSLPPVEVEIQEISLRAITPPDVLFQVRCSSGTYVRALARDLGRKLGVGAHLTELRRVAIGTFRLESAVPLEELDGPERVLHDLIPPATSLAHLPQVILPEGDAMRIRQGQLVPIEGRGVPEGEPIRILLGEELVGVGERNGDRLRPRKVLPYD
jgi:tRNA pseudouridine55 synthase